MEFCNGTTLRDILDNPVMVVVDAGDGQRMNAIEFCEVFEDDGELFIDFIPQLARQQVAPMPDDAIVSRNDVELSVGRYGLVLPEGSLAWMQAVRLLAAKT